MKSCTQIQKYNAIDATIDRLCFNRDYFTVCPRPLGTRKMNSGTHPNRKTEDTRETI